MSGVRPVEAVEPGVAADLVPDHPHRGTGQPAAGRRPRPGGTPWPALLDALEERTRRLAAVVEDDETGPVPEVALRADGPLPAELALRARALLAETERLTGVAAHRQAVVARTLRYSQS